MKNYGRPLAAIAVSFIPAGQSWAAVLIKGAVSGGITGGSKGALIGAFTAAAFHGIGESFKGLEGKAGKNFLGTKLSAGQFAAKIGAHGLVGGASSVLQGGKFGHGFAAAGATQAFAPAIDKITVGPKDGQFLRITVAALIGGSISEATGGKFAMGAVTGAFSRAFNDEGHRERKKELEKSKQSRQDLLDRITVTTSVDGDAHVYKIRGLICSASTTGCNESYADTVFDYVNRNDIPFTNDDLRTGRHVLQAVPFLPGDPIRHEQYNNQRLSINITLEGHRFHPGTVRHRVHFDNGNLYYDLTGQGTGSLPGFNNFIGRYLFRPGVQKTVDKFRLEQ